MCPANPVHSVELGLQSGPASHGPGLGDFQIQLLAALMAQTEAINRLAQSNEQLVQAMADGGDLGDEATPATFMDGSPLRR